MDTNNLEQIVLGSGDLYVIPFASTIPTDAEFETDANLIGRIKGGASVEYKPTTKTIKDDSGKVTRSFITNEEVKLKSGILTWCMATLQKLTAASTYAEEIKNGKRVGTLKIGGKAGRQLSQYLIRFVHTKADGYKLRCTIAGTASSGFTLAFDPEKETTVDAEFSAIASDADGTQVTFEEEYGSAVLRTLTVSSAAGSSTGKTAISVAPALASGCSYKYKIAASPTPPSAYDQVCTTGYTAWDGSAEIEATAGQTIVIVEVTTDGSKARGVGTATIVVA